MKKINIQDIIDIIDIKNTRLSDRNGVKYLIHFVKAKVM